MANRIFDTHILDAFRGYDPAGKTKDEILQKFDDACMKWSGCNPGFRFLCERSPDDASFYHALEIVAGGTTWENQYGFFQKRYQMF